MTAIAINQGTIAPPGLANEQTAAAWARFADGLRGWLRARTRDADVAEDLLQTVFLRVHERGDQLDDEEKIAGWIWQIARRALADHYRRQRPTAQLECHEPTVQTGMPDELQHLATWLRFEVQNLPPAYRDAVALTELQGMTMQQAAKELGLSVSGTKSRVQRGRAMLRKRLLRCCDVELDHAGRPMDFRAKQPCGGCA